VVFFSICSPLTVNGALSPERSVVFPYLQLQPALRFDVCAEVLSAVRGVGLVSGAERRLLRSYVRATPHHEELVGIGIDPSPEQSIRAISRIPPMWLSTTTASRGQERLPNRNRTSPVEVCRSGASSSYGPFAMYGGRVEPDNGCEEMLEYFNTSPRAMATRCSR
jgi:hypothetical protein